MKVCYITLGSIYSVSCILKPIMENNLKKYVYEKLNHFVVSARLVQYCKLIIVQ